MVDNAHHRQQAGRSAAMTMIFVLYGPIVWSLHFFALYGPQSLLCARGAPDAVAPIIGVATLAASGALIAAMCLPGRLARALRAHGWAQAQQRFVNSVMVALSALSMFAVVAAGGAALALPACPALR